MLNDARVASLGFFKDNVCTTRINKEKNFKIKFRVLLKFARILPDYNYDIFQSVNNKVTDQTEGMQTGQHLCLH